MKIAIGFLLLIVLIISCGEKNSKQELSQNLLPIQGTWKLISGTVIEKGDTTVTDYTKNSSFIKIINDSHFAFLKHDLKTAKDSSGGFDAGGGSYSLADSAYTEHLEYCMEPEWEGHDFTFVISINNDTLTQTGIEKVPEQGINRLNIERYVRLKK